MISPLGQTTHGSVLVPEWNPTSCQKGEKVFNKILYGYRIYRGIAQRPLSQKRRGMNPPSIHIWY